MMHDHECCSSCGVKLYSDEEQRRLVCSACVDYYVTSRRVESDEDDLGGVEDLDVIMKDRSRLRFSDLDDTSE